MVHVTTSNKYSHILPVFIYLFNKYWPNEECVIICYDKPNIPLPDNFSFHSMGKQGVVNEWSTDLRKYFEAQEDNWIIWLMEDTFIKSFDQDLFYEAYALTMPGVGRIDLTCDIMKREHRIANDGIVFANPDTRYRLSTQPSIWNKEFLLKYLTDGLTPWEFETQDPINDDWHIVSLQQKAVVHNEGVRKNDVYKLDLNGLPDEDIEHIKKIATWVK